MYAKLFRTSTPLAVGLVAGWMLTGIPAQEPATAVPQNEVAATASTADSDTPLATLDWLLGSWEGATENGKIEFSCQFSKNNAFLIRSFRISNETDVSMSGMQVVAWDPSNEVIRSWTFDSDGGFGEDTWSQDDDHYTMRSRYTLADGGAGSALHAMTYVDDNSFVWKSTSREIDGELQPDTAELLLTRVVISETNEAPAGGNE